MGVKCGDIEAECYDEIWQKYFPESANSTRVLLYQDELVVSFLDRKQKSEVHALVVPRFIHILGTESLSPEHHTDLLLRMVEVGERVVQGQLEMKGYDSEAENVRLGFHRWPLRSIDHLHLHAMAGAFVSCTGNLKYRPWLPFIGYLDARKLLVCFQKRSHRS
uniref:HIT domain-containing protein n=1 Tax=Timspurckia oligopyrenoides TaxID=708627 RepID=A0A7S1ESG8_9RHOD|mmetsp:Transcript_4453/g.7804  ORF Transcript_4453/g.7804 Transcript_4453/m.7804 type:complete len:163 (+) Transcript_4453:52-540(+)